MLLAQIETGVRAGMEVVDKASLASDRWLFLAVLAMLLAGQALAIRWLIKSSDAKEKSHSDAWDKISIAHQKERTEWKEAQTGIAAEARIAQEKSSAAFLEALKSQRTDLREEIAQAHIATSRMANIVENHLKAVTDKLVPITT